MRDLDAHAFKTISHRTVLTVVNEPGSRSTTILTLPVRWMFVSDVVDRRFEAEIYALDRIGGFLHLYLHTQIRRDDKGECRRCPTDTGDKGWPGSDAGPTRL